MCNCYKAACDHFIQYTVGSLLIQFDTSGLSVSTLGKITLCQAKERELESIKVLVNLEFTLQMKFISMHSDSQRCRWENYIGRAVCSARSVRENFIALINIHGGRVK